MSTRAPDIHVSELSDERFRAVMGDERGGAGQAGARELDSDQALRDMLAMLDADEHPVWRATCFEDGYASTLAQRLLDRAVARQLDSRDPRYNAFLGEVSDLLDWAISAVNANDEVEAFSDIEDEWEAREAVGYALGRRAQARR